MNSPDYDFAVVGGGSAGYAAASTAAKLGLKTVVIEGGPEVGGLCILRGCMPSKTLLESANRYREMQHAEEFGLRAGETGFDAAAIIARKHRLIGEFADYRREQLESGAFDFLRGKASFLDAQAVRVQLQDGTTRDLSSRFFLISTGSVMNDPDVPGLKEAECLTSDDILELTEIPKSLIVLGAGPVAMELAQYLSSLDCKVTILQRGKQVLTTEDEDVSRVVEKAFRRRGVELLTSVKSLRIERDGAIRRGVFTHEDVQKTVEAPAMLNALGRKPNTAGLGLEKAGVDFAKGPIKANPHQQTSVPHIFAAGDCTGPYEIVHLAVEQGELAARNAAQLLKGGKELESMDYRLKLYVVFTEPQVATVGLTEAEARAQGIDFLAASYPFDDHGKSLIMDEKDGFVKLVVNAASREIIGGCVVGPHASDLIHEVVVAMRFRATAGQLALIPHYHPTLSEIWTYPASELAE